MNSNGAVLSTHQYSAFGQATSASQFNPDPFGYKGQDGYYTDNETGLILCTFRYYDPSTGRWLTRDPIGMAGGINLYGYVTNNPVNLTDPLGLDPPEEHYLAMRQQRVADIMLWFGLADAGAGNGTCNASEEDGRGMGAAMGAARAAGENWRPGRGRGRPSGARGATGIGKEFEQALQQRFNNNGGFKAGGRDFDGRNGKVWYEAKSSWHKISTEGFNKFRSITGEQRAIARANGRHFLVISKGEIPPQIKQWLIKQGISFREL